MLNEVQEIKTNASKVKEGGVPNVPILMFSSNGKGTGWNEDVWGALHKSYMEKVEHEKIFSLDCSHYVHDIEYEKIANETEVFIGTLK